MKDILAIIAAGYDVAKTAFDLKTSCLAIVVR